VVALLGGRLALCALAAEPSAWRLPAPPDTEVIWQRFEALRAADGPAAGWRPIASGTAEAVVRPLETRPAAPAPPAEIVPAARAAPPLVLTLLSNALVDSEGVFLSQVVSASPTRALPLVRLREAPPFGQAVSLSRTDILGVVRKAAPDLVSFHWGGSEQVRITRRSRVLHEADLKELLTAALQRDQVKDKGELELRLMRPWAPMLVPDERLEVKILDLPASGVGANFIARFALSAAQERLGVWQAPLQARVWREVWVARSPLKPGTPFEEADVARERRDVLNVREALLPDTLPSAALEIAETVAVGAPLSARTLRLRPVVRRGQLVDAQFVDGAMTISLKVEVLENGAPGQLVRVRNVQSRREFKGKVQDEHRIAVVL
jgi:flagella basal body P-ring formation protein FlgA